MYMYLCMHACLCVVCVHVCVHMYIMVHVYVCVMCMYVIIFILKKLAAPRTAHG